MALLLQRRVSSQFRENRCEVCPIGPWFALVRAVGRHQQTGTRVPGNFGFRLRLLQFPDDSI